MKNNKKGFTLIELLAVIVILAILVMLAIPMVTRYLTTARKSAFSDNAMRAVEAVRNDVVTAGFSENSPMREAGTCNGSKCYYNVDAINKLLETKLITSPFGGDYKSSESNTKAGVCVVADQSDNSYIVTMVDTNGNGFVDLSAGGKITKGSGESAKTYDAIAQNKITNDGTADASSANWATQTCAPSS